MAGHNDWQGVCPVCASDRLCGMRRGDPLCKVLIGNGAAVGNLQQLFPNANLKRSTDQIGRTGEFRKPAIEIPGELVDDVLESSVSSLPSSSSAASATQSAQECFLAARISLQ